MMTQRPQNMCTTCFYQWQPRGHDVSPKCPNCGARTTTTVFAYNLERFLALIVMLIRTLIFPITGPIMLIGWGLPYLFKGLNRLRLLLVRFGRWLYPRLLDLGYWLRMKLVEFWRWVTDLDSDRIGSYVAKLVVIVIGSTLSLILVIKVITGR